MTYILQEENFQTPSTLEITGGECCLQVILYTQQVMSLSVRFRFVQPVGGLGTLPEGHT